MLELKNGSSTAESHYVRSAMPWHAGLCLICFADIRLSPRPMSFAQEKECDTKDEWRRCSGHDLSHATYQVLSL